MAADIKNPEVAFPFGEDIKIDITNFTCVIEPEMLDGKPTERGFIKLMLPYEDATCEGSNPKDKPRERLFSVCNQKADSVIFTRLISCVTRFTTNPNIKATVDGIGPKELTIVITGEGPKKNSSPS